jgi:hypothetical protein
MPKMMTLWAVAGSSALAGATLTYVTARTGLAPLADRARGALMRAKHWWPRADHNSRSGFFKYQRQTVPSGNRAYDEYREETLRTLDREVREFSDFLDRLRRAKDRSEFDKFMDERKSRPSADPAPSEPAAQGLITRG